MMSDLSLDDDSPAPILKECTGKDLLWNNRISDLPDDILTHILSLLTLKEAGSTSVLSKRWRHVWAYVPSLNFDASSKRKSPNWHTESEREKEEYKYFRWVDQVVSSHKAHVLDEFRVQYDLLDSRKDNIDSWLRFAIEKGVTMLQLDIMPVEGSIIRELPYNFPSLSSWNRLTSLELNGVEVSGEFLEKLLCDCQTLDFLSVSYSWSLVDFKIVGPLNLKSLRIKFCRCIKYLEISAPKLISFHYAGPKLSSWPLKSTPKLVEVNIYGLYANDLMCAFSDLSSCLSQIEVLAIRSMTPLKSISEVFPVCPRLKMLNIGISPKSDESLFSLSSLIKACPFLHKLLLELHMICTDMTRMDMSRKRIKERAFHHNNVKILEISGFTGSTAEMRFVKYLIKSLVSLEKITIKVDSYVDPNSEIDTETRGREEPKRLWGILKPGTELEVRGGGEDIYLWSVLKG